MAPEECQECSGGRLLNWGREIPPVPINHGRGRSDFMGYPITSAQDTSCAENGARTSFLETAWSSSLDFVSSAPALVQGGAAGVLTSVFNKRVHPWAGSLQNGGESCLCDNKALYNSSSQRGNTIWQINFYCLECVQSALEKCLGQVGDGAERL